MIWREPATCWEPDAARRVLGAEAESASEAVFLASHAPLPIAKLTAPGSTDGRPVDEEAVLAATLEQGLPIVAILGASGSGKSHMVRWLRHRMTREPRKDLVVVFVPKLAMSLRGIAERVLAHGEGPEFDDLRSSVASASEGLTEENVVLRLRSALANRIQLDGAEPRHGDGDAAQELRAILSKGLPAVLNDPYAGDHLMREGAPIRRLARENLQGRQHLDGDKERPFAFEAEDLRISVADVKQAAKATQRILGQLSANGDLRALGARMLNEQLEGAVQEVFSIGGPTIADIFLRLRRQLHTRGQRLLLLIEDFSIFQGVERGIIDALTLIPGEGEDFCELRAVMAVTTGYFANTLPDTVKTRTHLAFDLTPSEGVAPDVERFAAGYLNAARVGPKALIAHDGGSTPNACDACPVREECHTAFGATEGMGLFPLSSALIRATAEAMHGGFVAREYLTRVLEPVLVRDHADVLRGAFPGEAFVTQHRDINASEITADVRFEARVEGDTANDDRRANIAQLYADPEQGSDLWPPDRIYAAFGVTPPGPLPAPGEAAPPPPRLVDDRPDPDVALRDAIELWGTTGGIADQFRRAALQIVIDVVRSRLLLDNGHGGESLWDGAPPPLTIESFRLQTDAEANAASTVVIDRSDETVRALVALIRFRRDGGWGSNGGPTRRYVEVEIARWVENSQRVVVRPRGLEDELPHLIAALRADAWGRGSRPAFSDDPVDVLAALVSEEPPEATAADSEDLRSLTAGRKGATRSDLVTQLLRSVGHSQGTGKARVVDAVSLLDALEAAPDLPDPLKFPGKLLPEFATLVAALLGPKRLGARLAELRSRLPDLEGIGEDPAALVADLDATLSQLSARGMLPAAAVPLRDLGQRLPDLPDRIARLRALAGHIGSLDASNPKTVLGALATVDLVDAQLVAGWITDCERALVAIDGVLITGPAASPLTPARAELTTALDRLKTAGAAAGSRGKL